MRRSGPPVGPLSYRVRSALFLGLIACLLAAPVSLLGQTTVSGEDCIACHTLMGIERLTQPADSFPAVDVHAALGFTCLDCHRRDDVSSDPHAGFRTAPERADIPGVCGRCHSDPAFMRQYNPGARVDQVDEYWSSGHGQRLRESGDPGVATCADCHLTHQIRSSSDAASTVYATNVVTTCGACHADPEHMGGRAVGSDQVSAYTTSVHGRLLLEDGDVSAPVCNDCHGNHGAAPPGLSSVQNVCGQCHAVMADYFSESGHAEIFQLVGRPGCATCHGDHGIEPVTDANLTMWSAGVCLQCHQQSDERGHNFEEMAFILDSLHLVSARARDVLEEAENLGMEVSQALFELDVVNDALHRARSAIHTFHVDPVLEAAEAGFVLARAGQESGEAALDEHRLRRVGLGVFSAVTLLLISGLLLRLRENARRLDELISYVESFYLRSLDPSLGGPPTREQVRLAAAALMLEAAYADGRFSEDERRHLEELIRKRWGLLAREVEELIRLAERERETPGLVGRIADLISDHFTTEQSRVLLEEMWSLVSADGELSKREVEFLEDVADLLGVSPAELALARAQAIPDVATVNE